MNLQRIAFKSVLLALFVVGNAGAVDNVYYYHNDHLGTPQAMTDDTQGIAWQADYKPFGEVTITVSTIENNLRFPGQYFDEETGLHYNYFRDYDPVTGRYVESDPIRLGGGINTYAYGLSNPISNTDPTGEFVPAVAACLANPWCAAAVSAGVSALADFAWQLYQNDGELECVDYGDVAIAGGLGAIPGGIASKFFGAAATRAITIGEKVARQMGSRGWTRRAIQEAMRSGRQVKAINRANGNAAIRYVHPRTGQSVVVDDVTGEVIHVGG